MKKFGATSMVLAARRRKRRCGRAEKASSDVGCVSSRQLQAGVQKRSGSEEKKSISVSDSGQTSVRTNRRKNLRNGDNMSNNGRRKKGMKGGVGDVKKTRAGAGEGPAEACVAKEKVRKKGVSGVSANKSNVLATPSNRDRRSLTQKRTSTSSIITGSGMAGHKFMVANQNIPVQRSGSTISYHRNSSTSGFKGRSSTLSISSRIFSSSSRTGTAQRLSSSSEKAVLKRGSTADLQKTSSLGRSTTSEDKRWKGVVYSDRDHVLRKSLSSTDNGIRQRDPIAGRPPRSSSMKDPDAGLPRKKSFRRLSKSNHSNSNAASLRRKSCGVVQPTASSDGECESSVCTDSSNSD